MKQTSGLGILFLFQVASEHQINHKIGAEAAFVFRSVGGEARTYARGEQALGSRHVT